VDGDGIYPKLLDGDCFCRGCPVTVTTRIILCLKQIVQARGWEAYRSVALLIWAVIQDAVAVLNGIQCKPLLKDLTDLCLLPMDDIEHSSQPQMHVQQTT
jgi:hypothetical protein